MRKYVYIAAIIAVAGVVGLHPRATPNQLYQKPAGAPGEIVGRVIDPDGKAVWKARVHIRPVNDLENGRVIYYSTDGEGNFSINGLAPGEYKVLVVKEEDRHPDTGVLFYSNPERTIPRVVVSDKQSSPFVTVQTGPRAALIAGRVLDAVNGQPIPDATITFSRPEDKRMILITSLNQSERPGGFDFLLPSAPLKIQVSAPGYETWTYRKPGATGQADLLTATPGETIKMDIKLTPHKKSHP